MKTLKILTIAAVALLIGFTNQVNAQTPSAKEIIKQVDEKTRGNSNKGTFSMTITRPKWTRTITMKSWSLGTDYSLIYITEPAKEKGQVFLKRQMDMWNWRPSIQRTIKLPPSMMMQSWMGSDFTNDDLVKQSSIVVDYDHKILGSETIEGYDCYKIEMIPHDDAPVVWGKIITWVAKDGLHQLKVEFFDEDFDLVNTQYGKNIKKMDDRVIPTLLEIIPADKPNEKTTLEFLEMDFDIDISESFFSQQNMKKIK